MLKASELFSKAQKELIFIENETVCEEEEDVVVEEEVIEEEEVDSDDDTDSEFSF